MVLYEVQIRPLHPEIKNKIITNQTTATYKPLYNGTTDRTYTELDTLSDMLFYYQKTTSGTVSSGSTSTKVFTDTHARLVGDFWQVYTKTNSLKEATIISKQLIEVLGIDKVKIAKITPISSEVTFSENE